jgi:hypothetical protein
MSGFATLGICEEAVDEKTINLHFSQPMILHRNGFAEINVEGAPTMLYHAGKPKMPFFTTTMRLPFGTKIVDVKCEIQEVKTVVLSNKISPAPKPIVYGKDVPEYEMDETIYSSDELFPDNWFSYDTGGGLDKNNRHTTFLTLRVYPVRYNPVRNLIYHVRDVKLTISYKKPDTDPFPETSSYDLVVIAPSTFYNELRRLIDHKNRQGVDTLFKPLEEIYEEYNGVDKPEDIKYFIKDALETLGIKYVLLVGGLKSLLWAIARDDPNQGTKDWYLPVRYTNLKDMGSIYDPGCISDLYYADIYDGEGKFSSWDSNNDGFFASWRLGLPRDTLDLYPDVYVGRLPCRNNYEVKIMVDKIIDYESLTYGQDWFKRMVVVGGDSHEDEGTNYYEGEMVCEKVLSAYMTDFTPIRLYASHRDTGGLVPSTEDIVSTVSDGCGFLLFDGHGHPGSWNTHWPGVFNWEDTPGGIHIYEFMGLTNNGEYPICLVGGCHNSQFNVTFFATLLKHPFMWTWGMPVPECWSWWLTRKIGGGSIATFGNTGLGIGWVGGEEDLNGDGVAEPVCLEGLGGYMEILFFKTYSEGVDILGEVWGGTLTGYLNAFPGMKNQVDCKTIQQWPIIGDPSLKIGGYSQ